MPDVYFQSPSGFPQTDANRTREQAQTELALYLGGGDNAENKTFAGQAWDSAVREFNSIGWRFNVTNQSITLVADTKEYSLNTNFRTPVRGMLQDSNGNNQYTLRWLPYEVWLESFYPQSSGFGIPNYYTAQNIHNLGLVRFEPWPAGSLMYPTANITYLKRITFASGREDRLNVPVEVDEAIFQRAAAILLGRIKGPGSDDTIAQNREASILRAQCEFDWRFFGENTGWGAQG